MAIAHAALDGETLDRILAALDPEQRAAAVLPDGPAQIIAPAGSGKTTTMVGRIAVLLSRGVALERICVVTFNRDAARDLAARVQRRLNVATGPSGIEIRTLHAIARQVLLSTGEARRLVADRLPLLRAARRATQPDAPGHELPDVGRLDTWLSASKVEGREPPAEAKPVLEAYARRLAVDGAVDFDDIVVRAGDLLERKPRVRDQWQSRFGHVCVDEFQDVDAAQLRLVRLLAAPEDNLFVVGDDDQTIYAWRLADVRRILGFAEHYPSARRVMLATNYRCPASVVEASARMIAVNRERFAKPIRPPPEATARADEMVAVDSSDPAWADAAAAFAAAEADAGRSICFLSRTQGELTPVFLALVRAGVRHVAATRPLVESSSVGTLVEQLRADRSGDHPFHCLRRARAMAGWARDDPRADALTDEEHAAIDALLGWSVAHAETEGFLRAFDGARARLRALRDEAASVVLATVHASKGREWETVVLVGFEAERMPNRRSLVDADDPGRALEEERRLAYVALTRATRRLVLAFDPERPSPFLAEMGVGVAAARRR